MRLVVVNVHVMDVVAFKCPILLRVRSEDYFEVIFPP
jgi:hypothetical protein